MAQNSLFFFRDFERFDDKAAQKHLVADALPVLQALQDGFAAVEDWNAGAIHEVISAVANRYGLALGKVAQPLRVALSGSAVSPPIDITAALLGRDAVRTRLARAMDYAARRVAG